jgi:hypothetical protein
MVAPTIADITETTPQSAQNHSIDYPAVVDAGDLLICAFACDDDEASVTWPNEGTEWNVIYEENAGPQGPTLSIAWKEAVGNEDGTTFTITTPTTEGSCAYVFRITGAEDPDTQPPEASTTAFGSSQNPNSLSLTPTGGSKDYLWLSISANDDDDNVTGYPSNMADNNQYSQQTDVTLGIATEEVTAASFDPAQFTIAATESWEAATIAVHPVSAGTQYSEGPNETLTLTDNWAKSWTAQKLLTNITSLTDAVEKVFAIQKSVAETITLVDPAPTLAIVKIKDLSETATLTDTVTDDLTWFRTFSETGTLIDSVLKAATTAFAEVLTLTDTVDPVYSAGAEEFIKNLPETLALTDTVTKLLDTTKSEVVTFADTTIFATIKALSENGILSDTLLKDWTILRIYIETANLTDPAITALVVKIVGLTETVNLADSLIRIDTFLRTLTETNTLTDSFIKVWTAFVSYNETVTLTDPAIDAFIVKIVDLSETINLITVFLDISTLFRTYSESVTLTDTYTLLLQLYRTITETITLVDPVVGTEYTPGIGSYSENLSETLTLTESFLKDWTIVRLLTESSTLTDSKAMEIATPIIETVTLTDSYSEIFTIYKALTETGNLSDSFLKDWTLVKLLAESITTTDTLSILFTITSTFSEILTSTDTLLKRPILSLSETTTLSDSITKFTALYRILSDALTLTDTLTEDHSAAGAITTKTLTETLTLTDTALRLMILEMIEAVTVTDVATVAGFYKIIKQRIYLKPASGLGRWRRRG